MIIYVLAILAILVLITTQNFFYWKKRNVKHDTPIPIFGNHWKILFGFKSSTQLTQDLYNKYADEPVVGYFRGMEPELIVKDLDIVRDILSVDFNSFYIRGLGRDPDKETLLRSLFHLEGDSWKLLRQRMTPAFTTAKLKAMFPLIVNCAEKLDAVADNIVKNGGECDVRDLMARFTTEFIGACGFGIEMNSINDEHSAFRLLGKRMFSRSIRDIIMLSAYELFPSIRKMVVVSDNEIKETVTDIVKSIFEQRNYKPTGRNDFIDLLLELSEQGKIEGDSIENFDENGVPKRAEFGLDLDTLVAQVFVFFAAGFETSSSATSFTLHQLAYNPDIQVKIQNEIDRVLQKYDNKLCYDAISEMTLLDNALKEGMRLFPSLGVLNRTCAKKYTIQKLGITIDPGVKIVIPLQAIQHDEKYYDNPLEFRPERFASESIKDLNKFAFIPFGAGPRICIGSRLGQMQSLAGLAAILRNFSVEPSKKTPVQLPVDPWMNIVQGVKGGIPLKLTSRNK